MDAQCQIAAIILPLIALSSCAVAEESLASPYEVIEVVELLDVPIREDKCHKLKVKIRQSDHELLSQNLCLAGYSDGPVPSLRVVNKKKSLLRRRLPIFLFVINGKVERAVMDKIYSSRFPLTDFLAITVPMITNSSGGPTCVTSTESVLSVTAYKSSSYIRK